MVAFALTASALAIGHHLHYASLDASLAGSSSRQQWAIKVGTVLAYAVVSLFATTVGAAYDQYFWKLFKRNSYSLNGLDDLFALKSMPTDFLNVELLGQAKLAVFLALSAC